MTLSRAALAVQSDDRLVALARAGSDAAFAAIVERYRRPLERHSARILDADRAEDVVQHAFMNLHVQLHGDDRALQLRPWLFRVTHNLSLNAATKKGGDHEELTEELDGVAQPPQVAELRERLRATVEVIGALPERQRLALVRRELEGRSCEEIAAEARTSTTAVRQLLARARTAVRDGVGVLLPFPLVARITGADGKAGLSATEIAAVAGAGTAVKVAMTVVALTVATGGAPTYPSAGTESPVLPQSASSSAHVVLEAQGPDGSSSSAARGRDAGRAQAPEPVPAVPESRGANEEPEPLRADPPEAPPEDAAADDEPANEPVAEEAGVDDAASEPEPAAEEDPPPEEQPAAQGSTDQTERHETAPDPLPVESRELEPDASIAIVTAETASSSLE